MGYKNNIVINFDQSMEAIVLNFIYIDIKQSGIQRNNLEQKSQTITYNHDKILNIAKHVKTNISLRRMEFLIINRVSELKLNRWGRQGWKEETLGGE